MSRVQAKKLYVLLFLQTFWLQGHLCKLLSAPAGGIGGTILPVETPLEASFCLEGRRKEISSNPSGAMSAPGTLLRMPF